VGPTGGGKARKEGQRSERRCDAARVTTMRGIPATARGLWRICGRVCRAQPSPSPAPLTSEPCWHSTLNHHARASPPSGSSLHARPSQVRAFSTRRSDQNSRAAATITAGSLSHRFSASTSLLLRSGRGSMKIAYDQSMPAAGHSCRAAVDTDAAQQASARPEMPPVGLRPRRPPLPLPLPVRSPAYPWPSVFWLRWHCPRSSRPRPTRTRATGAWIA
jgi:hypothetical protein